MMSKYVSTIGIECHVQLKTKTKLFAQVGNDAREAKPNTLISHICVGMPGALPYLNEAALELAARAAFALGTKPQKFSKFDRKHYFYPDLPKGYQISQYEQPIIKGGHVEILVDGESKKIGITRAHLEEDAGKNTHPEGADYTLVDLNRAGTPLLEIVSEPDIHSPAEAKAFARELYLLMKFADVSDCDLYHGNMRFDVNVSLSKDPNKLGIRSEVKNLNSFRSVENAVAYEIKRQTEILDKSDEVIQETRGWDEAKQKTTSQRGKEEVHDYRYMPEPDVPPIELTDDYIRKIHTEFPKTPMDWRSEFRNLDLDSQSTEIIIERVVNEPGISKLLGEMIEKYNSEVLKFTTNFLINELKIQEDASIQTYDALSTGKIPSAEIFKEVYEMIKNNELNSTKAKQILFNFKLLKNASVKEYAKQHGYIQVSDEGEIDEIVKQVIEENSQAAEDVKNGELKAIGFLVGQVMAKSKGQANPGLATKLIRKQLNIEK